MPVSFSVVTPERLPDVGRFLAGIFAASAGPMETSLARWKYLDPHPWWPEGRGYLLETGQGIAAHGCAAPVRFRHQGEMHGSMQITDWASGGLVPGAGLLLYRYCLERSGGTLLAIGGSEDTLQLIPRVRWFVRKQDRPVYVRPLHAWRSWSRSPHTLRDVARLGRNLAGQFPSPIPPAEAWRCRTLEAPGEIFMPADECIAMLRTREWFDYLMRCPAANMQFVALERQGVPAGHALLAETRGSVQVADFVVAATAHHERVAAFASLVGHISGMPAGGVVVAGSSLPELCRVFAACGLRQRRVDPVYIADPRRILPAEAVLETGLLIGDAFYR